MQLPQNRGVRQCRFQQAHVYPRRSAWKMSIAHRQEMKFCGDHTPWPSSINVVVIGRQFLTEEIKFVAFGAATGGGWANGRVAFTLPHLIGTLLLLPSHLD